MKLVLKIAAGIIIAAFVMWGVSCTITLGGLAGLAALADHELNANPPPRAAPAPVIQYTPHPLPQPAKPPLIEPRPVNAATTRQGTTTKVPETEHRMTAKERALLQCHRQNIKGVDYDCCREVPEDATEACEPINGRWNNSPQAN